MAKDSATAEKPPREFTFNGMVLPDPDPSLRPDQVKELWAVSYPDLATAAVTGPETRDGKQVYKFSRAVGAKG